MDAYFIKPLVWQDRDGGHSLVARSPFGELAVWQSAVIGSPVSSPSHGRILRSWFEHTHGRCDSLEDGKAKLEAYYLAKMREGLEPVTIVAPPPQTV